MKALIFIRDSAGELDWLLPYLEKTNLPFEKHIILYTPNVGKERERLGEKIIIATSTQSRIIGRVDAFLDRVEQYLSRRNIKTLNKALELFRDVLSYVVTDISDYDVIFRDYNLKNSIFLTKVLRDNKMAKVVVFPHSTAITSNYGKKLVTKKVKCNIFLENIKFHQRFLPEYEGKSKVVGSPAINLNKIWPEIDLNTSPDLIITRNCDPKTFGFDQDAACKVLWEILASNQDRKIYIKHHPRDQRIAEWRAVSKSFANAVEVTTPLYQLKQDVRFIYFFYTSAFIPLLHKCKFAFDISPYNKEYFHELPYHKYIDEFTHEFSELKLLPILSFQAFQGWDPEKIRDAGNLQKSIVRQIFPSNSIALIDAELQRL